MKCTALPLCCTSPRCRITQQTYIERVRLNLPAKALIGPPFNFQIGVQWKVRQHVFHKMKRSKGSTSDSPSTAVPISSSSSSRLESIDTAAGMREANDRKHDVIQILNLVCRNGFARAEGLGLVRVSCCNAVRESASWRLTIQHKTPERLKNIILPPPPPPLHHGAAAAEEPEEEEDEGCGDSLLSNLSLPLTIYHIR